MPTVTDERDELERMLRKVCRSGVALPNDVEAWWTAEQQEIAAEEAAKEARKQARIAELQQKMADLQAVLDELTGT